MIRVPISERPGWRERAHDYGFKFHTMYGEPYWDETAYYRFSLTQIERDLEAPSAELHAMCLDLVDAVVRDAALMRRFAIPEPHWDAVAASWQRRDPSLYSRLDLVYDGVNPPKLLENNADTPTSLYETGFWQWLWLEDNVDSGRLPRSADQFNSVQEKLVRRFAVIADHHEPLYFSCCRDTEEDRGTVQYLEDCATEAGLQTRFLYLDDIGLSAPQADGSQWFTDLADRPITQCFKLYPWEFMLREAFAEPACRAPIRWIEPLWKAVLSNKAILPLLWQRHPGHPNLLPAHFCDSDDARIAGAHGDWVRKPLFSREGANIDVLHDGDVVLQSPGPYGDEGYILQARQPLPRFGEHHTLVGAWLIGDEAAGIAIREDLSPITQDLSRFLPHAIV